MGRFALFLIVLALTPNASSQSLGVDVDATIDGIRNRFGVVGLSVAVVREGRVIYAKGFGERQRGTGELVDADTLFAIGSNTKAFTAAGLGILVDDETLRWDDPVIDHLPWFQLHDPYVTREITIRDILSHRSGLGRSGDLNWYATDYDREEIVRRVRFLEPNSSFRSQAGYQNTMFLAAGLVSEALSQQSWDDWITSRLLRPLGMTRSLTTVRDIARVDNVASPHERIDDAIVAVPHRNIDNIAPAGSILSSAAEMARWMGLMLGRGEIEGKRLLSESVITELWKPNIIYPLPPEYLELFPSTHFSAYGLGWGLRDYHGRMLATHTGGIDGMLSQVLLVPEEALGIVVLTNTSPMGSPAHNAVTFHVLDRLLGVPPSNFADAFFEYAQAQDAQQQSARRERDASRVDGTTPSLPLASYVGEYDHLMYGTISVDLQAGALVVTRHSKWTGDATHWHYDTFVAQWRDVVMGESLMSFGLGPSGAVDTLDVPGFASFERRRDP